MAGETAERERRQVWVIDTDALAVVEAEAFSCAPSSPGYWWVPKIGYSVSGEKLYDSELAAVAAALRECGQAISWHRRREDELLAQRARLRERRAGAGAGERGE